MWLENNNKKGGLGREKENGKERGQEKGGSRRGREGKIRGKGGERMKEMENKGKESPQDSLKHSKVELLRRKSNKCFWMRLGYKCQAQ